MTDSNATEQACKYCKFCEPWYDPKPLFENQHIIVRLAVKDDMYRYVQVLHWFFGKWREWAIEPIDKCPICGREV